MSHGARLNVKMIVKLSLRLRVSEITKRVVKNFEMKKKLFTLYSSNGLLL